MNPKTKESLKTIAKAARAGKLGASNFNGCCYEDSDGKHCAIGILLTKEQIAKLKEKDYMNVAYNAIQTLFPELQEQLGLSITQAMAIQGLHDYTYNNVNPLFDEKNFIEIMNGLATGEYKELMKDPFRGDRGGFVKFDREK